MSKNSRPTLRAALRAAILNRLRNARVALGTVWKLVKSKELWQISPILLQGTEGSGELRSSHSSHGHRKNKSMAMPYAAWDYRKLYTLLCFRRGLIRDYKLLFFFTKAPSQWACHWLLPKVHHRAFATAYNGTVSGSFEKHTFNSREMAATTFIKQK